MEEKNPCNFSFKKNLTERIHLKYVLINSRIIIKGIGKKHDVCGRGINGSGYDQGKPVMNTTRNLHVALPICWQPTQVLTFHEGLCPTNKY
jgi:hypothetical protein